MNDPTLLDFGVVNATRNVTINAPAHVTRIVAIVDDALAFAAHSPASATFAVESAGGGGAATFSGGALVPDAAGTWRCSVTIAGYKRLFDLVVMPASTLDVPAVKYTTNARDTARDTRDSMRILQSAANDAATNISALTTGGGTANGACNWRNFGA